MSAPRVVLVDDEPVLRASLASALHGEGFEVVEIESPAALSTVHPSPRDVVVVDGDALRRTAERELAELKARPPFGAAHVLLLTRRDQPGDTELGRALGAEQFLAKPFAPSELARCARDLAGAHAR